MLKDERGSLSLLGIACVIFLLVVATTLLSIHALYLQQRQVANIADATALALAEFAETHDSELVKGQVNQQLDELNATGRQTQVVDFEMPDSLTVAIELCQTPDLIFSTSAWLGRESERVCAQASATSR